MDTLGQIRPRTIEEVQLEEWTRRAYRDEDRRARQSEKLIEKAVSGHPLLAGLDLAVYAKGSYKNNTNVRRGSDVDVAVEYRGIRMIAAAAGLDSGVIAARRGLVPYEGPLIDAFGRFDGSRLKDAIGEALVATFGPAAVARRNKVFTLAGGERTLPADVVPCASCDLHRSQVDWVTGIQLLPDRPEPSIVNFPRQHHLGGIAKNLETGRRFKRVVRILKNLENMMAAEGACRPVPSFLIESLVFNVPSDLLVHPSLAQTVRDVLLHIAAETRPAGCEWTWTEVNQVKLLFAGGQGWTRHDAHAFVAAAWPYVMGI